VLTVPPPFRARGWRDDRLDLARRFGSTSFRLAAAVNIRKWGSGRARNIYRDDYDYCAEYVSIMRELWEAGRSDFKGDFFQMDDCRCCRCPLTGSDHLRRPSDAGTRFARNMPTTISATGGGVNQPAAVAPSVARLVKATADTGRDCGALILQMVIADETDDAAMAKWTTTRPAPMFEALAWRDEQAKTIRARIRLPTEPAQDVRHREAATNQGVFVGSYAAVARMLDELATGPACARHADLRRFHHRHGAVRHRILPLMRVPCRRERPLEPLAMSVFPLPTSLRKE